MKFKIGDEFVRTKAGPFGLREGYKGVVTRLAFGLIVDENNIGHDPDSAELARKDKPVKRGPDNGSVELMEVYRAIG